MVIEDKSFLLFNGCTIRLRSYQDHVPPVEKGYIRTAAGVGWVVDQEIEPDGNQTGKSGDVL